MLCARGYQLSFSYRCARGPRCPQLKRDSLGCHTTSRSTTPMPRAAMPLALAILLGPRAVHAQNDIVHQADSVNTSIETVISGGYWKANGVYGRYRIVVVNEGWEEVRHGIVVQWLVEDQTRHDVLIRSSVHLNNIAGSYWSLEDPRLWSRHGVWLLTIKTTTMPMAQPTDSLTFELTTPGKLTKLR